MQQNGKRIKVNVTPMSSSINAAPSLSSHTISHKCPAIAAEAAAAWTCYRSCLLQLSVFIMGSGGITQSATAAEQAAHFGHSNSARTPLLLRLGQRETFGSCVLSVFARNRCDPTFNTVPCGVCHLRIEINEQRQQLGSSSRHAGPFFDDLFGFLLRPFGDATVAKLLNLFSHGVFVAVYVHVLCETRLIQRKRAAVVFLLAKAVGKEVLSSESLWVVVAEGAG